MGNCQAIDNASLQLQHPNGRVDQMYTSITASEIMKMHPGHYVALLLTTTLCSNNHPSTTPPTPAPTLTKTARTHNPKSGVNNIPIRITKIKLLKPTDSLVLGHVYRLITTKEVMKGLWAKKCAKMKQQQQQLDSAEQKQERLTAKEILELEEVIKKYDVENINQMAKHEKQRARVSPPSNSTAAKSRIWHPSLKSISEAAGN